MLCSKLLRCAMKPVWKTRQIFRTSSSELQAIDSIFHLFIQFSMEEIAFLPFNLNKQMEN